MAQFVYAIRPADYWPPLVKIGKAHDVKSRLGTLNTGSPIELVIECYYEVPDAGRAERYMHLRLHDRRVRGEWFKIPRTEYQAMLHATFVDMKAAISDGTLDAKARRLGELLIRHRLASVPPIDPRRISEQCDKLFRALTPPTATDSRKYHRAYRELQRQHEAIR